MVIRKYLLEEGLVAQLSALAASTQNPLIQRLGLWSWGAAAQPFHLTLVWSDGIFIHALEHPMGLAEALVGPALQLDFSLCLFQAKLSLIICF